MLFFHAGAQVRAELSHVRVSILKELVALDEREVAIELLHRCDLRQLGLNSDLGELRVPELLLEVIVLLLELQDVLLLLAVLLVTQPQIVPQLFDQLEQLLLRLRLGSTTHTSAFFGSSTSGRWATLTCSSSWATRSRALSGLLAVSLALLVLELDLLAQEETFVQADGLVVLLIFILVFILAFLAGTLSILVLQILLLASFEDLAILVGQEVRHRVVLAPTAVLLLMYLPALFRQTRLVHQAEQLLVLALPLAARFRRQV